MRYTGRFAVALALASALAIAATIGAIAVGNQAALPVGELLRVEEFAPEDPQPIDDPFRFMLEILGGTRLMTDADIADRFPAGTLESGLTGDAINEANVAYFAEVGGTLSFVRVKDREPQAISAVAASESGTPMVLALAIDENGHYASLAFDPDPAPPARLAAWEATSLLLAGWLLIAAAAVAWWKGAGGRRWALLGAALTTLASVLVFSDQGFVYTAGRVAPAIVVPFAAVLLTSGIAGGRRWLIVAIASAAAVVGFAAPLTRSATVLGHPEVVGALTDSETTYRGLLVVAAALTALAMGGAAVANLATARRSAESHRPMLLVASTIATLWAVAGLGSAIDYGLGSGTVASGPLTALGWSALALVAGGAVIGLVSGERLVPRAGPFAVALVLLVVMALGSLAGTVARAGQAGLPLNEQFRAESLPDGPARSLDDHVRHVFEVLSGTSRATAADADRFSPGLAANMGPAGFNGYADQVTAGSGPVRFIRFADRLPQSAVILAVAGGGTPMQLTIAIDDIDRQIEGFILDQDERNPRRVPTWQAVLVLVAAFALIAAAGAAWLYRAGTETWLLGAAAVTALALPLMLSDSSGFYAIGRIVPGFALVFAAALLIGPAGSRARRPLLGAAVVAGLAAALAVFVLDATPIGHPEVVGALTDSEPLYRALMAGAGVLAAVAMAGVAAINLRRVSAATRQMRQALWSAAAVAGIWAIGGLGAALDHGTGDGTLAGGAFTAITWAALGAVPAVVVFRTLIADWGRPEIAALVIDLEAEGGDLQPAIARALGDPSLQVLTSPAGERLLDAGGVDVPVDDLPDGRRLTRIESEGRPIGGLIHAAELQRDPDRLQAVAAAAGMAMQVSQLNRQIAAQLAEVDASRARILQASDTSRRRLERDLHDGAQQRLVAHGLRLQRARRLAAAGERDELMALLEDATREVRDTINDIRAVSRGAQPALLAERGLAHAVDALAERAPVPVRLDITANPLPASAERTAYYVIAEGLTNMAKHASATKAQVSITHDNGDALVTIRDDGHGGAEISPGSGLEGLNDRIAATGGTFNIRSGPDGTTLEATIPCG